jgi:hypothetical protein
MSKAKHPVFSGDLEDEIPRLRARMTMGHLL